MIGGAARLLLATALGFYFRRIELLAPERVPAGPLLIVANHPNSLADAAVLATALPRPFAIVATAALFRFPPLAWLLRRMGVISVNRANDDPRAMRSVAATFEAVYSALEPGGAVLIFPEGITYDEPALKPLKSGPARMALELEHRHGGKLGLKLLPVGLHYPSRGRYRGDALAHAGPALVAADFLEGYPERKKEAIQRLTDAVEASLKELVVHIPAADQADLVAGLLRLSESAQTPTAAQDLERRRKTAAGVASLFKERAAEAAAFAARLAAYESLLGRLKVDDAAVRAAAGEKLGRRESAARAVAAVVLLPVALWGVLHRFLPLTLVAWAVPKLDPKDRLNARIGTHAVLTAVPAFLGFYGALTWLVHRCWGWPVSGWYLASLPVTGLLAHAYQAEMSRLAGGAVRLWRLGRLRRGGPALAARRSALLAELSRLGL